jgi:F-type H+-transporting ATPase subunit delta
MAADKSTIARPYAKAAFADASAKKRLGPWSEALRASADLVRDERVAKLLFSPHVSSGELAQLVIDIAGSRLDEDGRNFVRTLAENRRLGYLPEISVLFDKLKDEVEGVVDVTVTSATALSSEQKQTLSKALTRKLKREVRLHVETDPTLIGGAVLKAGDTVIDGSLRARLQRIKYELTA